MGLLGDFKEAKEGWSKQGLFQKIVGLLTIFLSMSSLASLSQTIIQWKGFILDGIEFYRSSISIPLGSFVSKYGYSLTNYEVDKIVLAGIALTSLSRMHYLSYLQNLSSKSSAFAWITLNTVLYLGLVLGYLLRHVEGNIFVDDKPMLFTIGLHIISAIFYPPARQALGVYFLAIFFVLVLAAINKGLA